MPASETYFLYVLPNPVNACRVSLYKEHFVKTASGWIPDKLTEVQRLPDFGVMPDPDDGVEGQNTRVYLVDLWLPPDADIARFRLEVQLKTAGWAIRPMEVRVMEARFPNVPTGPQPALPAIDCGADAIAASVLGVRAAGEALKMPPPGLTLRNILLRNAVQDLSLARVERTFMQRVLDLFRANSTLSPRPFGAEWWLKVRDRLYAPM
jgi:hypothetical protein